MGRRLEIIKLIMYVLFYLIVIVFKLSITYISLKISLRIRFKLYKWRFKRTLYKCGLPRELVENMACEYSVLLDTMYKYMSIRKLIKLFTRQTLSTLYL